MLKEKQTIEIPCKENSKPAPDYDKFALAIDKLRSETLTTLNQNDYLHLRRVERRGRLFKLLGYLTAWIIPNPISAFCIHLGHSTRWGMAHHILHKGYDRIPGIPKRYTSKTFAQGWRRFIDWFDWIIPQGWAYEHNVLHHCHTGENVDPDLVERETEYLRQANFPRAIKYVVLFLAAITWKFTFYAPSTTSVLNPNNQKRIGSKHITYISILDIFKFNNAHVRRLWMSCYLPYGCWHFIVIPLLFLPLGKMAVLFVFLNKILAEAMANFHAFLVVGPNHTGEDLHRFGFHPKTKGQFYAVQVLGSVNYHTGTEWGDYSQMWLNYQIEHHLFSELPMSKYRDIQPILKALCAEHHIPYIQESVWVRFKKMADICVGKTSMQQLDALPIGRKN